MRRIVPFLLGASLVGCQSAPNSDQKIVVGEWDLVVLKGLPDPKGHLSLLDNGTFKAEVPENFKVPLTGKTSTISGTFTLAREHLQDRSMLFIDFVPTKVDNGVAASDSAFRLSYDEKRRVLFDITKAFCHPEERAKTIDMFAKQQEKVGKH